MVRAGVRIGENAVLGARGVAQSDIPDHHVAVGMPAKSVRVKPGFEDVAEPIDGDHPNERESRHIPSEIPDDITVFDEFQRDLDRP